MNKNFFSLKLVSNVVIYALLISISYVYLYPLFKIVSLTFMSQSDIINQEVDWIPTSFDFGNIKVAYNVLGGWMTIVNSMWVSLLFALAQTFVSALTGFAFARYEFRYKKFWFAMVLISFIIPVPVLLAPRIMMFSTFQTTLGVQMFGSIIPQFLMSLTGQGINSAILILIFFNFFKVIPISLDEAAKIDGASSVQILWHIIIKMSIPAITIVMLFSFVWNWNETYLTGIFIKDSIALLPMRLSAFDGLFDARGGDNLLSEAYKMAATFFSINPLLIIYLFAQKQFIEGIENTGITGE